MKIGPMIVACVLAVHGGWADEQDGWPCFHGNRRDNRSRETGLLRTWPTEGPALRWTATGIGHGYSSVAVRDNRVFTAGMLGNDTHVVALALDGKVLWQRRAGESWRASERQPWAVPYSGARATLTVDGDTVYFLSELGALTAFDAATGHECWSLDIAKAFEAEGWFCLDFLSGRKRWQTPGKGSLTYANGHLYCLDEKGKMSFVQAEPTHYLQLASFSVPTGGRGAYWAHPVVCGGRLYVRHSDHLYAYQISGQPAPRGSGNRVRGSE